jgi:hypothetical protein
MRRRPQNLLHLTHQTQRQRMLYRPLTLDVLSLWVTPNPSMVMQMVPHPVSHHGNQQLHQARRYLRMDRTRSHHQNYHSYRIKMVM